MSRDYERLDIVTFGKHLLTTHDLDPIYDALVIAGFEGYQLRNWLLAYWTFYHAGVACYLADATNADEYWRRFELAARNVETTPQGGRWPRGHERRHMRGRAAIDCYQHLREKYPQHPENFIYACMPAGGPLTCKIVMNLAAKHVQFGPWIGFKIADMMERVMKLDVSFEHAEVFMFRDPKKAALMLWREQMKQPKKAKPRDEGLVLRTVVDYLTKEFEDFAAPPRLDRPVGLQEVETILCKWKSHMNGHYPLNNDINEITAGLEPWLHSNSAQHFYQAMQCLTTRS